MKMKKMITKTVVALSLLSAGVVATAVVVPSGNVVYAATFSEAEAAFNELKALVLQARGIDSSLYTEESYTASYTSGEFRQNIPLALNMYQDITTDSGLDLSNDEIYQSIISEGGEPAGYLDWLIIVYNSDSSILTQAIAGLVLKDAGGSDTTNLNYSGLENVLAKYETLSAEQVEWIRTNEVRFFGSGYTLEEEIGKIRWVINNKEWYEENAASTGAFGNGGQSWLDFESEYFGSVIDEAISAIPSTPYTTFQDITSCSTEAQSAIAWLLENGITTGYNATTFAPKNTLTRAEMVTFLYRLAGKPAVEINDFPDTAGLSQAFRQAISWAKETGVTTGYNATTFAPNQPVLREQMASFFYRLAGKPTGNFSYTFEDVSTASAHSQAIGWLSQTGITSGYSPSAYGPSDAVTREQMALFLKRYADKVGVKAS
ncbi:MULTISPECIES: S-layer homology domain-containing protein [unclassified Enterococcus]|uniref:S-layer homology domain-containing protein n=1 Tax=unclassified Enterococcus TaxID=2608891 RepID=UPI0015565E7C|nr:MULTISPECIES: S-layer homology domain-containing protein [unclassified Enterococcus]MBS7576422.1 S-layer homology domain-containing protein [Enterococcus sp. MMGLQ5-2]MBS7583654.1 S-layer homology domain-containing protein [Enterococcus sp. MMGLQ5-1]NPD11515.1 S-layer homology domain-containing protein [Enterococcus sp. MMGLQ5-1]NPD36259.1 S-layer homology domain-containing protein [Enterococcus sp. MMGLQ5-2]